MLMCALSLLRINYWSSGPEGPYPKVNDTANFVRLHKIMWWVAFGKFVAKELFRWSLLPEQEHIIIGSRGPK
jgi:hypothetical protein